MPVAQESSSTNFVIVSSMMKMKVQISQLEYLQDHPEKLERILKFVKKAAVQPTLLESSVPVEENPKPFYISL